MELYRRASVPLALEAAREALRDAGITVDEVSHLITVSCTGMFLPGLDALTAFGLGLPHHVERIPLQFLGCAAGVTALRLAKSLVQAAPSAKVLIISVELCTLHIQPSDRKEDLFGAAFFGDGAAACVVAGTHAAANGGFLLEEALTTLFPDCEEEMVWRLGNHGFSLYLSSRIPQLLGKHVPGAIERLLEGEEHPELWAIHPGGRGIVDAIEELYELTEEQTQASRTVLRDYGNMSSATIFFVLHEMRQKLAETGSVGKAGLILAFGPGLHAELIRTFYVPPGGSRDRFAGENACWAG